MNDAKSRINCLVYDDADFGQPHHLAALERISDLLQAPNALVWLDIVAPKPQDFALIQTEFALHPLAIEDAVHSHQQTKIEAYGDSWFLVVHGSSRNGNALELHELAIFVGRKYVVTVRALPPYPLDEARRRWNQPGNGLRRDSGALLYTILDTVVDGYSPVAEAFEEQVEALESALLWAGTRTNDVLLEIYKMKKILARFRRAVVPIHDILVPIIRGDLQLFASEEIPYYRDVNDHVSRVIQQLDGARDLINSARDTHIAMATNRQNQVAKQLTIVATIFLPLTFVTGFFGQNFGYLVNHITSSRSFWWLGIGSEVVAIAALLTYFRFKRWF